MDLPGLLGASNLGRTRLSHHSWVSQRFQHLVGPVSYGYILTTHLSPFTTAAFTPALRLWSPTTDGELIELSGNFLSGVRDLEACCCCLFDICLSVGRSVVLNGRITTRVRLRQWRLWDRTDVEPSIANLFRRKPVSKNQIMAGANNTSL